jgi:hypothetical protein
MPRHIASTIKKRKKSIEQIEQANYSKRNENQLQRIFGKKRKFFFTTTIFPGLSEVANCFFSDEG